MQGGGKGTTDIYWVPYMYSCVFVNRGIVALLLLIGWLINTYIYISDDVLSPEEFHVV